ncbi:MAG: phosphoglucomutase/phosphomannomutase family protein, partial [Candidatus Omnitrophica bacterium]|nr:phosphoglucomutase/phosphomannomutase family protein [Candidatus Omnitrophota bacterium]
MTIRFGTSGWRAIIADEFTFFNVRKVTQAIVKYLKEHRLQKKGMLVGYDTRFLSKEFAAASAQAIADNDIKVFLTDRDAPTPVVAYHILEKKTAGAINITASHNPPQYNGIKFSPSYGGPAPPEITKEIERNIKGRLKFPKDKDRPFRKFDPRPSYLRRIRQLVDISAIRKADLK